ncbi:MAG: F0F1 ATP synthase subunit A [Clostridia bacterium]|nr:F0F1 ATP synthase subunit A [Clostridia bacterium]MBR0469925.1 F0F1 ATP synthase subunit A [Clostridia bacterium]
MNGPKILFTIPLFGGIRVTESIVNMWIIMAVLVIVSILLTRNLKVRNPSKRQLALEKLITMLNNLVTDNMGEKYKAFAPYIGTLFALSIFGSLSSLTTMRPYTADLSVILAWTVLTFFMIQANNIKNHGVLGWLKSFTQPVAFITPLNIISEIANPISMTFRHFGNIAAGLVITSLVYGGLAALSAAVLSWVPSEFLASIPILQAGIPAVLSVYFDLFTSFLQAYILCMLTMVFIKSSGE